MSELSGNNEHNIKSFITETIQYLEFPKEIIEIEKIYELVVFLMPSSRLDLNPRSIERILTLIAISINSCTKEKAKELSRYFIFLSFYKVRDKDRYHQFKKGKINSAGLLDDRNKSRRIFEWLQENFFDESQFSKSASNVIEVPGLFEAGGILDIYNIPSEPSNKSKKKDNYQSQEK